MPRSRGYQRPLRSQKRRTGWEEGPFTTQLSVSSGTPVLWTVGQTNSADGFTIARLRGSWGLHLTSAASVGDGFGQVGFAIGKVALSAFTAGIASVPTPLTEIEWEGWLYHEMISDLKSLQTAVPFSTDGGMGARNGVIDSKAMRKFNSDEVIFGALETADETGAASLVFTANTRMLVYLP